MYSYRIFVMTSSDYVFDETQMPSLCVIDSIGEEHFFGDRETPYELASITKIINAITICDVVASGFVNLSDQVNDPRFKYNDVYLYDLLAHTSGLSFTGKEKQVAPRSKRVYSNYAVELAAGFVGMKLQDEFGLISVQDLFNDGLGAILREVKNAKIDFYGSPAYGAHANLNALSALAQQMRNPTFIDEEMHGQMTSTYLNNLKGTIPGWGNYKDCAFGIGYEIKSTKSPHWMGSLSSDKSFGHFGQTGVFIMHDPVNNISIVALGDREFDKTLKKLWPAYVDNIFKSFL